MAGRGVASHLNGLDYDPAHMAIKDLFSFLFQRSSGEERVAQYVIREHDRGRPLAEIMEDRYVQNRLESPEKRAGVPSAAGAPSRRRALPVETRTRTRIVIT